LAKEKAMKIRKSMKNKFANVYLKIGERATVNTGHGIVIIDCRGADLNCFTIKKSQDSEPDYDKLVEKRDWICTIRHGYMLKHGTENEPSSK
jgi:hypothetical protein